MGNTALSTELVKWFMRTVMCTASGARRAVLLVLSHLFRFKNTNGALAPRFFSITQRITA